MAASGENNWPPTGRSTWPLTLDARTARIGFACAAALKAGWGLVYLAGWLAHGLPRGYASAAIWLAAGAWVLIISTWPEPRPGETDGGRV